MPGLTAVIITYNEENAIERCLKSLSGIADEIVVVDSFSTDRTKEICNQYAVIFTERKFDGYIGQKNFGNSLASNTYILSLDADEAVSAELEQSLLEWKKNTEPADAYTINRRNNYCGKWIKHSGWYPDKSIRLFNRLTCRWGGPSPHEYILTGNNNTVQHIAGDLLHWSYLTTDEHRERSTYYAELAASSMKREGKKANALMMALKPPARFIKHYILKLGFLDGREGFIISKMAAREVRLKYSLLKRLT